jgi:RHS repeat-associated protein
MPTLQSAYAASTNRLVSQSYDAAGNQLVFGSSNLAYDAENRQLTATDNTGSGAVVTYAYDGLGQRVSKSSNATGITTIYVHDAFGNLAVEYNPPAAAPCTTCYFSWDHLGSTRMVTDPNASQKALHDYVPFGMEIPTGYAGRTGVEGASDGLSPKFTSQDRDADTGLDFFQARYMASAQGRFTSADPAGNAVADPANPQSWNMYSYAGNNPLAFVDPTGLFGEQSPVDFSNLCFYVSWACAWQTDPAVITPPPPPPPPPPPAPKVTFTCQGTAAFSAVGPNQATSGGALAPQVSPAKGTVAIAGESTFGIGKGRLRSFAPFISIAPQGLNALLQQTGGPAGPYSVSDIGDQNIRNSSVARFDIYRFDTQKGALAFGLRTTATTIEVPAISGAHCPEGFTKLP